MCIIFWEHLGHKDVGYTQNASHHHHPTSWISVLQLSLERCNYYHKRMSNLNKPLHVHTEWHNSSNNNALGYFWLLKLESSISEMDRRVLCLGSPHIYYKWLYRNTKFTLLSPYRASASMQKMANVFSSKNTRI